MEKDLKTLKNISIIFLITAIFVTMYLLSSILIPLVLALLFAILFQPVINALTKIHIPKFIILPILVILTVAFLFVIGYIIYSTGTDIALETNFLLDRFNARFTYLLHLYNEISGQHLKPDNFIAYITKEVDTGSITKFVTSVAGNVTKFSGDLMWFVLYYVILLAAIPHYKEFFRYIGGERKDYFLNLYNKIQRSIVSYVLLKALLNLILGIGTYVVCLQFGIKFPLFWACLMFFFHFIPTIGAFIGIIPAVLMAILQFDSIGFVALFAGIMCALVFIMGNFIEPKVMGSRLRINTLTVLFSLVFWSYCWGIAGALLSVPLAAILKLTFEEIPDLSFLARFMGSAKKQDTKTAPLIDKIHLDEDI